jgi:hypothetical protein
MVTIISSTVSLVCMLMDGQQFLVSFFRALGWGGGSTGREGVERGSRGSAVNCGIHARFSVTVLYTLHCTVTDTESKTLASTSQRLSDLTSVFSLLLVYTLMLGVQHH